MGAYPRSSPHHRIGGFGLTVSLLLLVSVLPASVVAQEPSAEPSPAAPVEPSAGSGGEMVFPSTLAGAELEVLTYSGPEWLTEFGGDDAGNEEFVAGTEALLQSLGRDVDDLTVKSALAEPTPGTQAVILGLQVEGASARDFAPDAVELLLGDVNEPRFVLRPLGSRWVLRVEDAAVPGVYPRTVYLDGDTAWIIGADEGYVSELLDQLPEQAFDQTVGGAALAARLPVVLDDRRRTGLYEAREPLFLPTLERRIGPAMDAWLVDVFLRDGLTPTDLVGAISWWGVESSEESVEIEGYQVPGGSPEIIEALLTKVFLGDGQALPDEVSRTEQELGGHQVTTFDFGYSTQHLFASGDTIWVVTDHAGEPAVAEEAIAALP